MTSLITTFISQLKRRELSGSSEVALATANLLLRFVSAARWTQTSQLIDDIRALGKRFVKAQPREFASGNVVRRVLGVIREVGESNESSYKPTDKSTAPLISSMFGLLSTKNDEATSGAASERPNHKDERADIIEGIQELIDEIGNLDDTIAGMSLDMIHENEVLLTPTPNSKTVQEFLLRAGQKRKFTVIVAECYPNEIESTHAFARKLQNAGIETVIIPDTATFAVMSRVGKVVIGTRTVLANGGCVSSTGVSLVCECAKEYKTPVLAVTGLYKLSPLYPFDIENLIEVGDSGKVIDFRESNLMSSVEVMNPTYDYVAPEHIDIYITNLGGFSPSFTYRIVLDHYSQEDVQL